MSNFPYDDDFTFFACELKAFCLVLNKDCRIVCIFVYVVVVICCCDDYSVVNCRNRNLSAFKCTCHVLKEYFKFWYICQLCRRLACQ